MENSPFNPQTPSLELAVIDCFNLVLIAVCYFKVPLIGWRIGDELAYLAEGASHDTSSIIIWAQNMGMYLNETNFSLIILFITCLQPILDSESANFL